MVVSCLMVEVSLTIGLALVILEIGVINSRRHGQVMPLSTTEAA